ncbi:hypothetical protein ACWC9S_25890 [Streptomyces xiamenensis]
MGVVGLTLWCMGCSVMDEPGKEQLDHTPTVSSVDDSREAARQLSSRLFDIISVQGEASQPGPGVTICEEDPDKERLYKIHHPWSISGVPREALREGMERLREALPQEGWTVVEEGEANNANRSPMMLLENTDVEYAVYVTLAGKTDADSLLLVSLTSACFSTPQGQSPKNEF